jgi:hypothetical protein
MGLFDKLFQNNQADLKTLSKKMIVLAISLNDSKEINKFLSEMKYNSIEADRFVFCLSVLNFVSVMWAINIYALTRYGKITEKVRHLLNLLNEEVNTFYASYDARVRIGDYIINDSEMESVVIGFGVPGISKDTRTTLKDIISVIFNPRMDQYLDAFNTALKAKTPGMLDPVPMVFMKHFVGEDWQNKPWLNLMIPLSFLLTSFSSHIIGEVSKMMDGVSW